MFMRVYVHACDRGLQLGTFLTETDNELIKHIDQGEPPATSGRQ